MKKKILLPTLLVVAAATWSSLAQNTPTPDEDRRLKAATGGEDVGIAARDGITISGADVLVTRNGRSEKLEKALTLDGGTKINPDGTVRLADGREVRLLAEQRLTFDGRLLSSPIPPNTPVVPAGIGARGGAAGNAAATGTTRPVTGQGGASNLGGNQNNNDRNNNNGSVVPFVDPGTVVAPVIDPATGRPVPAINPTTGQPVSTIDPATGRAVNPVTGQPAPQAGTAAPLGQPANANTPAAGSNPNNTGTTTPATPGVSNPSANTPAAGSNPNNTGTTTRPNTGTNNATGTGTTSGTGTTRPSGSGTSGGTAR